MNNEFFNIEIANPVCIEGLSEDALRALVNALTISVKDPGFGGVVLSSPGAQVKFNFGPDGNFSGVTAKINGMDIVLIPGVGSQALQVFAGPPSATNPGVGWEIDAELTQEVLSQPANQNLWKAFFARRAPVLNSF